MDTEDGKNFDATTLLFYVNGKRVEERSADPRITLAVYLRDYLQLKGTKIGCNEGGCGACTVMLSDVDPSDENKIRHYSVNACLTPICAVFGKAVTTVEGIGGPQSASKRLHPVQERLAKTHGSQCGYCTPGFVMAMYSLLRNNSQPTQAEIDESMQGNLCRCTGYRPILEAFYSFIPTENGTAKLASNNCCGMKNNTACCKNMPPSSDGDANNNANGNENGFVCCKSASLGDTAAAVCCRASEATNAKNNNIKPVDGATKRQRIDAKSEKKSTKPARIINGFVDLKAKNPLDSLNVIEIMAKNESESSVAAEATNDADELVERVEKLKLTTLDDCQAFDGAQEPIFPPELRLHKLHRTSLAYEARGCRWLQPTSLEHLLQLKRIYPHARLISGNSELAVELKFRFIALTLAINPKQIPEMRKITINESQDAVCLGMGLSLTEVKDELTRLIQTLPESKTSVFRSVCKMLHYFAGKHVRNMASIAGNIATASPISDLNPIWMATSARVVLASEERGKRLAPVDETLFVGYRRTTIAPDEVLTGIWIPFSRPNQFVRAYKQALRREDDITIVTGAFSVSFTTKAEENGAETNEHKKRKHENALFVVDELRIAYAGMAPTTKLVSRAICDACVGRSWNDALLEELSSKIAAEFRLPLDVPGGQPHYRLSLTLSFLFKFYAYVAKQLAHDDNDYDGVALKFADDENDGLCVAPHFHTTQIFQDVPRDQPAIDPVGRPLVHQSGEKHTTGEAVYATDTKIFDCLHMVYVMSPIAYGTINAVDASEALALEGVVDYIDVSDVPGSNDIGHGDTKIFAINEVLYYGQPIGAIVAVDHETARRGANLVRVAITPHTPIVSIEDAIRVQNFLGHPTRVRSCRVNDTNHSQPAVNEQSDEGDEVNWSKKYKNYVKGQIRMGGQEHFYLETQNCVVVPGEGGELDVVSSTQCISDVQRDVGLAMRVPRHKIRVSVRRIGGGFGGKESCCGMFAAAAAVAASKLKRAVRLVLERYDDMAISGTRHPFRFDYQLAVDVATRRILDFRVDAYSNCGYIMDLSKGVMERCVTHMDNVYKLENAEFVGRMCRTHTSSNTAFRGFGGPQGMFAIETALKHAAEEFHIDVDELRAANFYAEGDQTPFGMHLRLCNAARCWTECVKISDYEKRRDGVVAEFNRAHRYRKRGIYATPTKFGIGFGLKQLNQAGALAHIYTDGSVLLTHGGMEMGQGLHTKIIQIAARCLEIDASLIHIHDTATDKVPNASPTAASVGSDMNGLAIQDACRKLMERLKPFRDAEPNKSWTDWVTAAYVNRVSLSATGFAIIHSEPVDFLNGRGAELYGYCVYGAAVTEVEVDCLTGDHHILRTDIVMDVGDSLNPAVDIGQIEGAFVQGYGLFTMEELKMRPDGVRLTRGPGTYKIPSADDVPREFHVKLLKGSSNNRGIFSSKAVGEPPLFLGASALFAIREAIRAYRSSERQLTDYFRFDSPATPERIRMACADEIIEKVLDEEKGGADATPWTIPL